MAEGIIFLALGSVIQTIVSNTGTNLNNSVRAYKSNEEQLKAIAKDLEIIKSVCQDAEAKQYTNERMKIWLSNLRDVVYDIEDVLDDVATREKQKTVNRAHLPSKLADKASYKRLHLHNEVRKNIKHLREKLSCTVAKRIEYGLTEHPTESPSVERDVFDGCGYLNKVDIVGRDDAKNNIIKRVERLHDECSVSVLHILGMGGIGKTALAKLVYRDIDQFDIKLWVCVSQNFVFQKVLQDILKGTTRESSTPTHSFDQLPEKVQSLLSGKKIFLVLDDVWEDVTNSWNDLMGIFNVGGRGSVILMTSRLENVAVSTQTVEPYHLTKLSGSDCWRIFRRLAFAEGEEKIQQELCNIGKSIVEKCRGIPLAVKCVGNSLRSERNEGEWSQINSMDNFYQLKGRYEMVKKTIKLSYDELPSDLKPCFAHLSLFARNSVYVPYYHLYCCSALGLLKLNDGSYFGNNFFDDLSSRSMLQDVERDYSKRIVKFTIHDAFHSVARDELGEVLSVVSNENLSVLESSRFIAWESAEEVQEPVQAKKARSFIFRFPMRNVSTSYLKGVISSMPYLRILCLGGSHFEELPSSIDDLKHLRFLDLSNNGDLRSLSDNICKLVNLECLLLDRCKRLELPSGMNNLISLRFLSLTTCQNSLVHTKLKYLSSLRHLWLESCTELVSLWDTEDIGSLSSLLSLQISDCPKLKSLPNSMKFLDELKELLIHNCQNLDLERGDALSGLKSLQMLLIERVPSLSSLPPGIKSAAKSLKSLWVRDCESFITIPNWLNLFTSLANLGIVRCYNLQSLPKAIYSLNSLRYLDIRGCPSRSA